MEKFFNLILRIIGSIIGGYFLLIVWGVLNFTDADDTSSIYVYGLWAILIICLSVIFYPTIQTIQSKTPQPIRNKVSRFGNLFTYALAITIVCTICLIIGLGFFNKL